ncbi:MAG: helix-turn-helix transcriptional regulator [Erysipelotrichales bacterium]|nr:helix-turn-helix transcriptional regulator [Erysipelotrichales bacterium]
MIDSTLLKYYREANNLTTKQLAKKIRVSKSIIEKWENDELEPREEDVEKLCKLYAITKEDLLVVEKSQPSIIISILLFIASALVGVILNNFAIGIVLPIVLVTILNVSFALKYNYDLSKELDGPKTVFGILLEPYDNLDRYKFYLLESIIISSSYILINIICKIFNFTSLLITINITNNETFNYLLIWLITFVLLTIFAYLIEYVFGELMIKKYYGGKS